MRFACTTFVLMVVCCSNLLGQESGTRNGIFASREHYFEFMGRIKNLDDPEINALIPAMNDVIRASHKLQKTPFGSPFHSSKSWMMRLLENDGVRDEIEMLDYQFEEIKNSSHEVSAEMTEAIRDWVNQPDNLNAGLIKKRLRRIRENAEAKLDELVLPQQQTRLRQLLMHGRLMREPTDRVLTTGAVADELELSERQIKDLRSKWREIEKKLSKDIAELRAKARKELSRHLKPDQQQKFDELFGEDFRFTENESDRKAITNSDN